MTGASLMFLLHLGAFHLMCSRIVHSLHTIFAQYFHFSTRQMNVVSSVYMILCIGDGGVTLFTNASQNRGPDKVPCGTPTQMGEYDDWLLLNGHTVDEYGQNHLQA